MSRLTIIVCLLPSLLGAAIAEKKLMAANDAEVEKAIRSRRSDFIHILRRRQKIDDAEAQAMWKKDLPRIVEALPSLVGDIRDRDYSDELAGRWIVGAWAELRAERGEKSDLSDLRSFGRRMAYINISSTPDAASVTVDDTEMDDTPCDGFVPIKGGQPTKIHIEHGSGYEPVDDERHLNPAKKNEFSYKLRKAAKRRSQ